MADWHQQWYKCCTPASTGTTLVPAVRIPAEVFAQAGSQAAARAFCTAESCTEMPIKATWKITLAGRPLATQM